MSQEEECLSDRGEILEIESLINTMESVYETFIFSSSRELFIDTIEELNTLLKTKKEEYDRKYPETD